MAFFHVDLWNVSVQEYLVLPGTDNVAAAREMQAGLSRSLFRCGWEKEKRELL